MSADLAPRINVRRVQASDIPPLISALAPEVSAAQVGSRFQEHLDGYREMLSEIERLDLVEQVAPIQLALRLLVTSGSRLHELGDLRARLGPFDPERLIYPWRHPDPRVDRMADEVLALVGRRMTADRRELFDAVRMVAHDGCLPASVGSDPARLPVEVPYLNEPWYC